MLTILVEMSAVNVLCGRREDVSGFVWYVVWVFAGLSSFRRR